MLVGSGLSVVSGINSVIVVGVNIQRTLFSGMCSSSCPHHYSDRYILARYLEKT